MLLRSLDKFCITLIVVVFLLPPLVVNSDEQEDQWGPEIGSDAPSIDLEDTTGKARTKKSKRTMNGKNCLNWDSFYDLIMTWKAHRNLMYWFGNN